MQVRAVEPNETTMVDVHSGMRPLWYEATMEWDHHGRRPLWYEATMVDVHYGMRPGMRPPW